MRVWIDRISGTYGAVDDLRIVTLSDDEDHTEFLDVLDEISDDERASFGDVFGSDVSARYSMPDVDLVVLAEHLAETIGCSCGMADLGGPGHDHGTEYVEA